MVPGVLLDLLLPLAPVHPVLGIGMMQQIRKVIPHTMQNVSLFYVLNKINDLTGLPEFPIKPGTPGGPLLPCWTNDDKYKPGQWFTVPL